MMHPLVKKIEVFCRRRDMAESTFGNLAVKDSRVVKRLRAGQVTLRTIARLEAWMAEQKTAKAA